MQLTFSGEVFHWRGPAPHHWVAVPAEDSEELATRPELSYGWGCIPAVVSVGRSRFETSLMPKDGRYLVPIKVAVRRAEGIELGDTIALDVRIGE
ncbi:DUF1905 domain-containing protein [Nostocoides sp. F2B08]|uniref:DUF1905 domain-containing protein n=1 Tax=Nostocoides sp. F2B08 TaxID=2653936 RepID=UPI001262FCB0|nr:DUF1905 domain-containing protein [Tetrasphaera sp. F2B08]KAB7745301.1 DUF1905 domain-containing protein [Tetrasphaera sp. F2B08]